MCCVTTWCAKDSRRTHSVHSGTIARQPRRPTRCASRLGAWESRPGYPTVHTESGATWVWWKQSENSILDHSMQVLTASQQRQHSRKYKFCCSEHKVWCVKIHVSVPLSRSTPCAARSCPNENSVWAINPAAAIKSFLYLWWHRWRTKFVYTLL